MISSLNVTKITLHNSHSNSSFGLTGVMNSSYGFDQSEVEVYLTPSDVAEIKARRLLATTFNDTFISLEQSVVKDSALNPSDEILPNDALQVVVYTFTTDSQ